MSSNRSRASLRGEAEHDRVDHDVVARREIEVEADSELDEGRQAAADGELAAVDPVDARDALQQRALAAAVPPDDPEELARAGCRRRRRRRPARRRTRSVRKGWSSALLERAVALVGKPEGLAHLVDVHRGLAPYRRGRPALGLAGGRAHGTGEPSAAGPLLTRAGARRRPGCPVAPDRVLDHLPLRAQLGEHPLGAEEGRPPFGIDHSLVASRAELRRVPDAVAVERVADLGALLDRSLRKLRVESDRLQAVGGEHEMAARLDHPVHLVEPAQAELGREVRPDRDRERGPERALGNRQRRSLRTDEGLDPREVRRHPFDRAIVRIAPSPADVRERGGKNPQHASGRAPKSRTSPASARSAPAARRALKTMSASYNPPAAASGPRAMAWTSSGGRAALRPVSDRTLASSNHTP